MKNYLFDEVEEDEDILKERDLRSKSSEELLIMYGKYKFFLGDESNGASAVAWDIEFDSKLIFNILLERLNKNAKNIEEFDRNYRKI